MPKIIRGAMPDTGSVKSAGIRAVTAITNKLGHAITVHKCLPIDRAFDTHAHPTAE